MGIGTDLMNNKLLVTGGHVSNKQSDTIELVGLNGTEVISDLKLPKPSVDHCQIYWNETTWLFVGVADETYFVNFEEKKWSKGPTLNEKRRPPTCATLQLEDKQYIVVAGGYNGHPNYGNFLKSTEILDKQAIENGWTMGQDLPKPLRSYRLSASPDRKSIFALGGYNNDGANKDIFEFRCPTNTIDSCEWKKSDVSLMNGRWHFTMINIPDSVAEAICE